MSTSSIGRSGDRLRHTTRSFAAAARWLHIYASMVAFATMLLFSVTGLTLNHPDWFGENEAVTEVFEGRIAPAVLGDPAVDPDGATIDPDVVAAAIRSEHTFSGGLADRRVDERDCTLTWKGPGCAADAVIDRRTGRYSLAITRHGLVAVFNDLHKGRDTGPAWSLVIDATAVLLTFVAVTGFVLIFFIRRRRMAGLVAAAVGTLLLAGLGLWALM
jgi:hypothetical protein